MITKFMGLVLFLAGFLLIALAMFALLGFCPAERTLRAVADVHRRTDPVRAGIHHGARPADRWLARR